MEAIEDEETLSELAWRYALNIHLVVT